MGGKRKPSPGKGNGAGGEAGLGLSLSALGATPLSNIRHERYCVALAEGHNRPQAYRLAYQRVAPSKNDYTSAYRLSKKEPIRQRVAYLSGLLAEAAIDRKVKVVMELEKIGFASIADVITWDEKGRPKVKASVDLTPDQLAAIGTVKQTRDGLHIEQHSKLQALRELAEIHGAYPDRDGGGGGVTVVIVAPEKLSKSEWVEKYGEGRAISADEQRALPPAD